MAIVVSCPSCGGRFQAPDRAAGRQISCPKCQATITVPSAHAPPPPPTPSPFETQLSAPPPHIPPSGLDDLPPENEPMPARITRRVPGGPSVISDFLAFRTMIVPVIIQILFWIGVVAAVGYAILMFLSGTTIGILLGLASLVLGPLVVRCYCELLIIFFRINETLTEIKNELQRRPGP